MDTKNKKVRLNDNVSESSNDRISNLPDTILHHILSFVDMKEVVQTCVLSKKWQYVWTHITCLNFTLDVCPCRPDTLMSFTEEKRISFVNFMDQVLSRRCTSDILKFGCFIGAAIDVNRLTLFVDHALQKNVQELEITYSNMVILPNRKTPKIVPDPFEIPRTLFTSKSLTVLKLGSWDYGSINFPGNLSSSTLKELHLRNISLYHQDLISECPNLKCLTLVKCYFGELEIVNINATQLTNLEILSPWGVVDTFASPWNCFIIVHAPNLTSFKYKGWVPLNCSMGNPLNINTVDVNIYKTHKTKSKRHNDEVGRRMSAMLLEFQHAKTVTLSLRAMKMLLMVPGMQSTDSSPFRNLKNLRVNLKHSALLHGLYHVVNNSPEAKTTLIAPSLRFNMEDTAKWC